MPNQVKITINKVKDRQPEELKSWRRKYLKRKNEAKRAHNRAAKDKVTSLKRTLRKLLGTETVNATEANKALSAVHSALDKAAKNGALHKRTAARRKSRLSKEVARHAA